MLDFTSSLYLGIDPSSQEIEPWQHFTTGKPAALYEPKEYRQVARQIANLQGLEDGAIAKSTLHLFWDLFGLLSKGNFVAFVDSSTYPIAQWGLVRFASTDNLVVKFRHHRADILQRGLRTKLKQKQRPVVVTDGWCTHCGKLAPLRDYLDCVRTYRGLLVVDDTQALGIFGQTPHPTQPYGFSGGGSLKYLNIGGPDIILVSSLAKGLGVPIASITGSHRLIDKFKSFSVTREHCSPPSRADIHAAEYALSINEREGDRLRIKLFKLVQRFKRDLLEAGIETRGGLFPVQKILPPESINLDNLYLGLNTRGVKIIALKSYSTQKKPDIAFLINTTHTLNDINLATNTVKTVISENIDSPD